MDRLVVSLGNLVNARQPEQKTIISALGRAKFDAIRLVVSSEVPPERGN